MSTNHLSEIDRLNTQLIQKVKYVNILQKQREVKEQEFGLLENKFRQDSTTIMMGGTGSQKETMKVPYCSSFNKNLLISSIKLHWLN